MNKSWRQQPKKHQLYGQLPPITKTIQVRRTRHAGHCWRSRDELISDVLLWTPTYGRAKAGQPVRTYIQQLCEDTGCSPEDMPGAMNDWEKWRERVRDIRACGTTWWWWWSWWTVSWFCVITQEWWFHVHFIHVEIPSISVVNSVRFPPVLSFFMHYCTKALEKNVIYNSAERCYLLINGALKMGGE